MSGRAPWGDDMSNLVPSKLIESRILWIRGQRVMLDADLAEVYGVTTKRLNEQVRRNKARFPPTFMFQLTATEKREVVANCDHLKNLKFAPHRPHAFTEHGALMLASVLNGTRAIQMSLYVVNAFINLRAAVSAHKDLQRRLDDLEKKYDNQFHVVFDAIRGLMEPKGDERLIVRGFGKK